VFGRAWASMPHLADQTRSSPSSVFFLALVWSALALGS
jgi:hypothetical protein